MCRRKKRKNGIVFFILLLYVSILTYLDGILIQAKHYKETGKVILNIIACWKYGFTFEGIGAGFGLTIMLVVVLLPVFCIILLLKRNKNQRRS